MAKIRHNGGTKQITSITTSVLKIDWMIVKDDVGNHFSTVCFISYCYMCNVVLRVTELVPLVAYNLFPYAFNVFYDMRSRLILLTGSYK